jgi:hypothetical protein
MTPWTRRWRRDANDTHRTSALMATAHPPDNHYAGRAAGGL